MSFVSLIIQKARLFLFWKLALLCGVKECHSVIWYIGRK